MTSSVSDIKALVSQNKTADALSMLLQMTQENKAIHDSVLLISSKFTEITVQKIRGTISNEEAIRFENQVNEKILETLNVFDSKGKIIPGIVPQKKNSAVAILAKMTLGFAIIGGLILIAGDRINDDRGIVEVVGIVFLYLAAFSFLGLLLALVISTLKA